MKNNSLWSPRYWGLWATLALLRLLVFLPLSVQLRLGRQLGQLVWLSKRRTHIARVNLQRCFPDKDAPEIEALIKAHYASLGMALFETASSWWMSDKRLEKRIKFFGIERLLNANENKQAVILFTAHFTTVEMGGRFMSMKTGHIPGNVVYRPNENPVLQKVIFDNRQKHFAKPIGKDDIRSMLRALRKKEVVWYAPDQNYSGSYSAFAPFFGLPASTNTATSKLAEISDAVVLPFVLKRVSDEGYYELHVMEALENYPSGDEIADATRTNKIIEDWAYQYPEQYLWIHRRFKTQPEGEDSFY